MPVINIVNRGLTIVLAALVGNIVLGATYSLAQTTPLAVASTPGKHSLSMEPNANTEQMPRQILRTGINLNTSELSANSRQLADSLKLTPVIERIASLHTRVNTNASANAGAPPSIESLSARLELTEALTEAQQIIQETSLAVDFTIAEINAEEKLYSELLSRYQDKANKAVVRANWGAYYSNGALWAVAEALDIPTWNRPKYSIPSGINGIIAGVIPSIASIYAMHASGGGHYQAEGEPNMLSKIFNLPVQAEIEYPQQVWNFLNTVPAGDSSGKTRSQQLVKRWVADKNIPSFTNSSSKMQIELVAAAVSKHRAVTIDLLQTREAMLNELGAEIMKMKRLLFELTMAVRGEKQI